MKENRVSFSPILLEWTSHLPRLRNRTELGGAGNQSNLEGKTALEALNVPFITMPDTPFVSLYVNHVEKCRFNDWKPIICASLNYSFVQLFHFRYNFHSAVGMRQQKTPFFTQYNTVNLPRFYRKLPATILAIKPSLVNLRSWIVSLQLRHILDIWAALPQTLVPVCFATL